ncbi:MAG TPA: DNA polymerase II large subunit [Candidatus Woesearchaeota archaeon]|nr:DNA polymerase II large subunit [Candidatus Woesearchaeota archaeon]
MDSIFRRTDKYFSKILDDTNALYALASKARKKGIDAERKVEIKIARNMAERVFGLIADVAPHLEEEKLIKRIKELEEQYEPLDWRVALLISEEIAKEKFGKFNDVREAMEVAIRTGFAYHTVGIVAAPLEGFTELCIKKRNDGKDYLSLKFSGPIRGAGGTAAAFCVMLADFIRIKMGYSAYDPSEKECRRYITELIDYNDRVTPLQYAPSEQEVMFLVKHIPVEISGEPTELLEVSNYKDLARIETNRIRGGMALVLSMTALKAPKLWKRLSKWGAGFGLDWGWLDKFLKIQETAKSGKKYQDKQEESAEKKLKPNFSFISELVAGRPVFSYPLTSGGFRMRYGRARNTGYSAAAVHPATMAVVDDFIAIGTQLKVEMPGKAASVVSCDSIEPPVVLLESGEVKVLSGYEQAKKLRKEIKEILFLGDILFNYGDYSENNHVLAPPGYCPEWWFMQAEKKAKEAGKLPSEVFASIFSKETMLNYDVKCLFSPLFDEAALSSRKLGIPLHPNHIFFWNQITPSQLIDLYNALYNYGTLRLDKKKAKLVIKYDKNTEVFKRSLELIGIPHELVSGENIVVTEPFSRQLIANLGIDSQDFNGSISRILQQINDISITELKSAVDLINVFSEFTIMDKCGTFIGARMGRPEKGKMRQMKGSPHMLFPVAQQGDRLRSFNVALEKGFVLSDFGHFVCTECSNVSVFSICEKCGSLCDQHYFCNSCKQWMKEKECPIHNQENQLFERKRINLKQLYEDVKKQFKIRHLPDLIKGVRGTTNKDHVPEHFIKGILRSKHDVYVNKDGTIRFDMTELPLTHFKPKEIHTSLESLRGLGYDSDIYGNDLCDEDQIIEIFPQDIILPIIPDCFGQGADSVFIKVASFIDELLEKAYGLDPFYKAETRDDLVGHLVVGLAPHISAGTVGRIIGFSNTQGMICSPFFHAALRRDCDGDEGCVMLLLDAFLNFSKRFLPDRRGSRTMDSPLVLTTRINPSEVDDMVLGIDIVADYPLEFYESAMLLKMPYEVEIEQIKNRLGTPRDLDGFFYTHPVSDINQGNFISSYKTLPTMAEKLDRQMQLAVKLRSVREEDVARLVIEKHFLKDLKGNLRKFSIQKFRCVSCNESFRRPPLSGKCTACGGRIIFTISEGSVLKYLAPTLALAEKYGVSDYLKETLRLLELRAESLFGKEKEKQEGLGKFFA